MQREHEWFFLVSLVEDTWRIDRGLFLDSFSSSTIMTREIPSLVVSQTVFEGKKDVEKHGLANTRSNLFE